MSVPLCVDVPEMWFPILSIALSFVVGWIAKKYHYNLTNGSFNSAVKTDGNNSGANAPAVNAPSQ